MALFIEKSETKVFLVSRFSFAMFGARITSRLNAARSQVSRNQKRNFFGLPEEGVRGEAYAKFEADKEAHAASECFLSAYTV